MSYEYIAQPYTAWKPDGSLDHFIMEQRYFHAAAITAQLLRAGRHVYSPIVHCHELAKIHTLPCEFAFWKEYNMAMLARASGLIVLKLDGWEESEGLAHELQFAEDNMPITYFDIAEEFCG